MALPVKNQAFILPIRLYKTDGTRITAPGTVTAKVMQDSDLTWDTVGTATKLADGRGTINLELTAGEMNADRVDYEVWDDTASCMVQTGTIFTCSATRGLAGTALPDAAADAAGGLPISDAGGLDLDTYIKRLEAAFTSTIAARIDENISAAKTLTAAYDAAKTAASQTSVNDIPTNAELASALEAADDAVLTAIGALNNLSSADAQAAAAAALIAYGASTYAGADTPGTTTLLSRIVGTLLAGDHTAQSGDAYARLGAAGAGLTALGDARLANLDAAVSSREASGAAAAAVVGLSTFDPATDEVDVGKVKGVGVTDIDDFKADVSGLSTLDAGDLPSEPPSAATIASQVRTNLATELARIDAAISTRLATAGYTAPDSAATIAAAVWTAVSRTLTAFGFEVTATVDEEALAAAIVAAIVAEGIEADVDETAIALAVTTALGSLSVTVASPVGSGGTITIHAGDDYLDAEGRSIAFTIADATHTYLLDDGTAVVKLKSAQATWTATSITSTAGGYIVKFEPDAEDTAALTYKQSYEVEATLTSGSVVTLCTGNLVVARDIPEGT